ncbi:adenosine receptor A3-like [Ptychodera flava]|uniref:adenosine receptor A3-like n=1 Tax=Ptychodera flava TaxID=63121 RepID=UPI00396A3AA6
MNTLETYIELLCCMFNVLITIFGLIGNVAVCYVVYANKKLRTPSNYQLISLAIADGLVCLVASPIRLALTVKVLIDRTDELELQDSYVGLCKMQIFVVNGSSIVSVVTIATLAIIRALAVVGKYSRETLKTLIKIFIFVSYATGIAAGTMKLSTGEETYVSCYTPTGESTTNHKIKYSAMIKIVISMLTIIISYTCILVATRRHRRNVAPWLHQQQQATQNRMDIATLRVSFTIVICFFATFLPIAIYFFVTESETAKVDVNTHLINLLMMLVCLGSAVNPIIYALMSKAFRRHLKRRRSAQLPSRARGRLLKTRVSPATGNEMVFPECSLQKEKTWVGNFNPSPSTSTGLSGRLKQVKLATTSLNDAQVSETEESSRTSIQTVSKTAQVLTDRTEEYPDVSIYPTNI